MYREKPRGTGKNLRDLYRRIPRMAEDIDFLMYTDRTASEDRVASTPNACARKISCRGDRFRLWEGVGLPLALVRDGVRVLHSPANFSPPVCPCRLVLTVHDVIPLRLTDGARRREAEFFRANVARGLKRAAAVITVSHFSKREIVAAFGVPEAKVEVIYWAPEENCFPRTDRAAVARAAARYGLSSPYVFALGAGDPRKNTRRLIEAFKIVREKSDDQLQLLIGGIEADAASGFQTLIADLGLLGAAVLTPYLTEDDLPLLMCGAVAFAFVSLYEGFGLPVLDAMACATPVVCSRITAMPEIAGEAAFYVDPFDPGAIAEGLLTLTSNEQTRSDLIAKGLSRVREFSWERTARKTLDVLRRAAGQ